MPEPTNERKDTDPRITMLDARDRFTEVVDKAMSGEPQVITRYGRDSVVVIGMRDYERLRALDQQTAAA